ncbi:hypothetical protein HanPSC8_Chr17g0791041 [Helianthus annuus]|nr:hypothetical protein HanPSC8_Chr17g0791041 [Helianthus annuus]
MRMMMASCSSVGISDGHQEDDTETTEQWWFPGQLWSPTAMKVVQRSWGLTQLRRLRFDSVLLGTPIGSYCGSDSARRSSFGWARVIDGQTDNTGRSVKFRVSGPGSRVGSKSVYKKNGITITNTYNLETSVFHPFHLLHSSIIG